MSKRNATSQGFLDRIIRCRKKEMFIYSQLIRHNLHNVIKDKANKITISEANNSLKGGNIN